MTRYWGKTEFGICDSIIIIAAKIVYFVSIWHWDSLQTFILKA